MKQRGHAPRWLRSAAQGHWCRFGESKYRFSPGVIISVLSLEECSAIYSPFIHPLDNVATIFGGGGREMRTNNFQNAGLLFVNAEVDPFSGFRSFLSVRLHSVLEQLVPPFFLFHSGRVGLFVA